MAKTSSPMRLEQTLVQAATAAGQNYKRSAAGQIEYWAEIGRAVERVLDPESIIAVQSGLAEIKLKLTSGQPIEPDAVFNTLESDRRQATLSDSVTGSDITYQASHSRPGMLEQINPDGNVIIGQFRNGQFVASTR